MGWMRFAKIFVLALIFGQVNPCLAAKKPKDAATEMRRAAPQSDPNQQTLRHMAPTVSSSARVVPPPPRSQRPAGRQGNQLAQTMSLPSEEPEVNPKAKQAALQLFDREITASRERRDYLASRQGENPEFLVSSPSSRLRPASAAESLSSEISGFRMPGSLDLEQDTKKLLQSMDTVPGYMSRSDVQALQDLHAIPVDMNRRLLERKVSVLLKERPITDKEAEVAEFKARAAEIDPTLSEANRRQQLIFKHRAAMADLEAQILQNPSDEASLNRDFEKYADRIAKLRSNGYDFLMVD